MYYSAKNATIKGNVKIGKGSSIWYGAVVRASKEARITIGDNTNIQDNCVLHVDVDGELTVGSGVTIGHGAIVHCRSVGDDTLIGMGATILNRAKVGKGCIIGANALVTIGMEIPDNSLVMGCPAKIVRSLSEEEVEANRVNAMHYVAEAPEELEPKA